MMTVEQFVQMDPENTEAYELVEGDLIPLPSQTPIHSEIRGLVTYLLREYFNSNPIGQALGGVDCQFGENTVRRPDVSIFLDMERLRQIDQDKIPVPFAPDIAVEVLAPPDLAVDVRRRVRDYLRAGSKEVWLLDEANGEVDVDTATGIRVLQGSDTLESALLPGFSATVAELVVNI